MTYAPDQRSPLLVKAQIGKASGVTAAALALACMLIAGHEGEVRHVYADKLAGGIATYCYGSTAGAVAGKNYTHAECLSALQVDAQRHAVDVQRYLPANLPDQTAAAFYDFGYNVGAATFAKSSVSRKALAGDLPGACRAMALYVFVGGKDCRLAASRCGGIVKRRDDEVALCLKGLAR